MEKITRKYLKGDKYYDYEYLSNPYLPENGRFYIDNQGLKVDILDMFESTITLLFLGDEEFSIHREHRKELDRNLLTQMDILLDFAEQIYEDPEIYDQEEGGFKEDRLIEVIRYEPVTDEEYDEYVSLRKQGKIQTDVDFYSDDSSPQVLGKVI